MTKKLSLGNLAAILTFVYLLVIHGNAKADEDWVLYGVTKYLILFYDAKSITHPSKDTVKLWIKSVSKCNDSKEWAVKNHPNCANVDWVYVLTLTEINCSIKQDHDVKSVGYSKEGGPVVNDEGSQWSDIPPESYAEGLYLDVCP
jgi:hypothetical protein